MLMLLLLPLLLLLPKLCGVLILVGKVLCSVGNEMQKLVTISFVMLWIIVEIIAIRDTISCTLPLFNCLILGTVHTISKFMQNISRKLKFICHRNSCWRYEGILVQYKITLTMHHCNFNANKIPFLDLIHYYFSLLIPRILPVVLMMVYTRIYLLSVQFVNWNHTCPQYKIQSPSPTNQLGEMTMTEFDCKFTEKIFYSRIVSHRIASHLVPRIFYNFSGYFILLS